MQLFDMYFVVSIKPLVMAGINERKESRHSNSKQEALTSVKYFLV